MLNLKENINERLVDLVNDDDNLLKHLKQTHRDIVDVMFKKILAVADTAMFSLTVSELDSQAVQYLDYVLHHIKSYAHHGEKYNELLFNDITEAIYRMGEDVDSALPLTFVETV